MYFISKSSEVWATLCGIESLFASVSVCPGMHGHPGGGVAVVLPAPRPASWHSSAAETCPTLGS